MYEFNIESVDYRSFRLVEVNDNEPVDISLSVYINNNGVCSCDDAPDSKVIRISRQYEEKWYSYEMPYNRQLPFDSSVTIRFNDHSGEVPPFSKGAYIFDTLGVDIVLTRHSLSVGTASVDWNPMGHINIFPSLNSILFTNPPNRYTYLKSTREIVVNNTLNDVANFDPKFYCIGKQGVAINKSDIKELGDSDFETNANLLAVKLAENVVNIDMKDQATMIGSSSDQFGSIIVYNKVGKTMALVFANTAYATARENLEYCIDSMQGQKNE